MTISHNAGIFSIKMINLLLFIVSINSFQINMFINTLRDLWHATYNIRNYFNIG